MSTPRTDEWQKAFNLWTDWRFRHQYLTAAEIAEKAPEEADPFGIARRLEEELNEVSGRTTENLMIGSVLYREGTEYSVIQEALDRQFLRIREQAQGLDKLRKKLQQVKTAKPVTETLLELSEQVENFKSKCISGFYEDKVPSFSQGVPTHELQDFVTADEVQGYVREIRRLWEVIESRDSLCVFCKQPIGNLEEAGAEDAQTLVRAHLTICRAHPYHEISERLKQAEAQVYELENPGLDAMVEGEPAAPVTLLVNPELVTFTALVTSPKGGATVSVGLDPEAVSNSAAKVFVIDEVTRLMEEELKRNARPSLTELATHENDKAAISLWIEGRPGLSQYKISEFLRNEGGAKVFIVDTMLAKAG